MQKENKLLAASILILIFSVVIFLIVLKMNSFSLERREIPISLEVSDRVGFDVNSSALTFGKITPGGSSTRNLILENNYGFPIKLKIEIEGNVLKFLSFEKVVFIDSRETKKIIFSAVIPGDEKFGKYSGKVIITIKKDI
jgi:hypothetical protein